MRKNVNILMIDFRYQKKNVYTKKAVSKKDSNTPNIKISEHEKCK